MTTLTSVCVSIVQSCKNYKYFTRVLYVSFECLKMEFNIINTTKNRECLIFRNFKFHFSRNLVSGNVSWRCVKKDCSAYVKTNCSKSTLIEIKDIHNHEPNTIEDLNLLEVRGKCKRKACEDLNLRPNKIIRTELSSCSTSKFSDINSIRKSIYRERRKVLPPIPKSLDEAMAQISDLQVLTNKNEQFKFVDSVNNIILITCKSNLNFLCNYNTHIFGDSTFTYRPSYFYQMYGIHGYKNGFYIPLIIAFLPSKSFDCYLSMWNFICELCINENQRPFNPISMHLDFEIAAHQAFRKVFNNSVIKACRFHLGQSWYRKINSITDLKKFYNDQSSDIAKWLIMFFGLPFLPSNEVEDAFFDIQNLMPDFNLLCLSEFSDYILYNYIIIGCKFPPPVWAEPPSEAPRTTNCAESFHKHFNSQFYSPHPPITNVIENLKLIQVETYLKIKEVNKGTVKPKRNEEKERIEFACTTWTEYQIKNITRVQYLKKIAYKFRGINLS